MSQLTATLSFGFHEVVKHGTHVLMRARAAREAKRGETHVWRTLSENMKKPIYVSILAVIGPRWNCHAVIGSFGPVRVERKLACDVSSLRGRADSWSIVVYDRAARTVAWAGSATAAGDEVSWELPPGHYQLAMRYYSERDEMVVPNVHIDGVDTRSGRTIEGARSDYQRALEQLRNKQGAFYRALHYYAFHALRNSSRWVRSQFLPVGNPDTDWHFGHLDRGERLRVAFDPQQNDALITYVSFYNWASFPVDWHRIEDPRWLSQSFDEPVGYAIRRVRTRPAQADEDLGPFEARAVPASAAKATTPARGWQPAPARDLGSADPRLARN